VLQGGAQLLQLVGERVVHAAVGQEVHEVVVERLQHTGTTRQRGRETGENTAMALTKSKRCVVRNAIMAEIHANTYPSSHINTNT